MSADSPAQFRAIQIVAPRRAVLGATALNVALGPRQVEGPTIATVVSPGTELSWRFAPPDPSRQPEYPVQPGYAAVFQVEQVGKKVRAVRAGDVVFCAGPHIGWQRQHEDAVIRLPTGLDPKVAGFARLMAVTMATLSSTKARPPSHIGVSGLGVIGHLGARIFFAAGYRVTAWDPRVDRRDALTGSGIDVRSAAPIDDRQIAGSMSLVLECAGHEQAVLDSCSLLHAGGEAVVVGVPWQRHTDLSAHELLRTVFERCVTLRSGWESELPMTSANPGTPNTMANLEGALAWLATGRMKIGDIAATVRPSQIQQVYDGLLDGSWPNLTAVIDWTEYRAPSDKTRRVI